MSDVDPDLRWLPLHGLSLAIVVASLICVTFSVLSVTGRLYVRISDRLFGFDDGLMGAGTLAYVAEVGLAVYASYVGVGTKDAEHNAFMAEEAPKYLIIWILVYVVALAMVKSSIAITILRIGSAMKPIRIAVWCLLVITWASFIVMFVGVLLYCRPISANWDASLLSSGEGTCASVDVMIVLSHTATVSTIITDLGCVILPGIVLWSMQMKLKAKIGVFTLLSFASLASIMTICRAPFIQHYADPTDNLMYYVGFIMLFSNVETAIGCIATSVPTLRLLFVRGREGTESGIKTPDPIRGVGGKSFVTFGGTPVSALDNGGIGGNNENNNNNNNNHLKSGGRSTRHIFRNPTDTGLTFTTVHAKGGGGGGDWELLQDGDSDKGGLLEETVRHHNGIRADYSYTVELTQSPKHTKTTFFGEEDSR
ncbi:hypothetical protein BX600DRAFT_459305 [Xylariales sp. PMI_506]|nr:hypothetical protein BX600DRAFT_459305 [Xylariales sp. PMI_506]